MSRLRVTVDDILTSDHVKDIPIVSNATVYTKAWKWGEGEYFAVDYKGSSSGTVGLLIELEQSNVPPATEGSSDGNYVVAENQQDIEADLSDKTQHIKKLSPVVSVYGRLKITGSGSNDATTTLRAKLARQEESA